MQRPSPHDYSLPSDWLCLYCEKENEWGRDKCKGCGAPSDFKDAFENEKWDKALEILAEYHDKANACVQDLTLRITAIQIAFILSQTQTCLEKGEWSEALNLAQKALMVDPGNADATVLRTDAQEKLQLKTLASQAHAAYSRRDLIGCKNACDALLSYQQSCGGHVEFTDASGNVIDFKNLHWKLDHEIAIQREAERQQLAEQARVRKAIIMVRFFKTTVTCVIVALVLLGLGHWRKVRFNQGVQAFERAMQAHGYDEARAMAPPVADKYMPASSLLAYFRSKESFESALSAVNSSLLRQYGPKQWADLQSQKQVAEAGVGNPDKGIDAYHRAMSLLAECQALADSGEKARKDKEASEKALAAARARSEQARIKAAENAEDVKLIARIKNDLEILIASIRAETAMFPKPNESMVCTPAELMDAANRNIPEAQILIGLDSLFGFKRFNKDRDEASALFRKAAEQGHPYGQYQLGMIFSGDHDDISAAKWFRKAADKGLMEAQSFLGNIYWEGVGVNKDASEAVKWWRKAAEQGYTTAENNLGQCFLTGQGVTKNKQEGIKWLRRAAAKGYGNATAALAELQEEPSMTEQSPTTKEDALAQNNLGFSYLTGDGVRKDPVEAAKWLSRAARNGSPNAQCTLGIMYNQGLGVEKDDAMAARWFRRSADQGFAAAQLNLGTRYINGTGVPRNEAEGFMWIRRAAKQGDEDAIRILRDNNISL